MLTIHKACILIVTLLLLYDYFFFSTYTTIWLSDPKFRLLGPYNVTNYSYDDVKEHLIDLTNFTFKLNSCPCDSTPSGLLLMVIVSSNPVNFENRVAIRNSWGKSIDSTKIVFLVGEPENTTIANGILNESMIYGDIVQGNFKDVYHNMTYKHVMGLKWVTLYCSKARYVLKTDDDVVVNIRALRVFLAKDMSPWGAENMIACQVLEHAAVQRSYRSKWRVSPAEYGDHYYPAYCAGKLILIYRSNMIFNTLI